MNRSMKIIKNQYPQIHLKKFLKIVYLDEEKKDDDIRDLVHKKPGRKKKEKEIPNPDDVQTAFLKKSNRGRPPKYKINEAEEIPQTNAIPVSSALNRLLSPLFRRSNSEQVVPTPF